jgi:molybdenum cofactor biosynthesis enzyme MoaA
MGVIKNIRPAISPLCNMKCRYCYNNSQSFASMEDYRHSPITEKILCTEEWLSIFKCFYDAGFRGIALTGGEPTLNPDWMNMLEYCHNLGFIQTEVNSNLTNLERYKNQISPEIITKFIVSLDTFDKNKFQFLTNSNKYDLVLDNIQYLIDKQFNVQLNRVCMKSTLPDLIEYIEKASKMNVGVTLLDLVNYKNKFSTSKIEDWKSEFIQAQETWDFVNKHTSYLYDFKRNSRYGYEAKFVNNDKIVIFKDSTLTKRADRCLKCPGFCQEGIYTVHIASDGSISTCPDYNNDLPYIDGLKSLKENTLTEELVYFYNEMKIEEKFYFDKFNNSLLL